MDGVAWKGSVSTSLKDSDNCGILSECSLSNGNRKRDGTYEFRWLANVVTSGQWPSSNQVRRELSERWKKRTVSTRARKSKRMKFDEIKVKETKNTMMCEGEEREER